MPSTSRDPAVTDRLERRRVDSRALRGSPAPTSACVQCRSRSLPGSADSGTWPCASGVGARSRRRCRTPGRCQSSCSRPRRRGVQQRQTGDNHRPGTPRAAAGDSRADEGGTVHGHRRGADARACGSQGHRADDAARRVLARRDGMPKFFSGASWTTTIRSRWRSPMC